MNKFCGFLRLASLVGSDCTRQNSVPDALQGATIRLPGEYRNFARKLNYRIQETRPRVHKALRYGIRALLAVTCSAVYMVASAGDRLEQTTEQQVLDFLNRWPIRLAMDDLSGIRQVWFTANE